MIISLTTIPSRSSKIDQVIKSIENQTWKPDKIVLNIPKEYKRFPGQKCNFSEYVKSKVIFNDCEDYGPLTKLLPALYKYPEQNIITVDDDCSIHPYTFEVLATQSALRPQAVIGLRGRRLKAKDYNYHNATLIECNGISEPVNVDIITGVWSALYNSLMFDMDDFNSLEDINFMNDDITLCGLLQRRNIDRLIVPANIRQIPTESHTIDDLWSSNTKSDNNNNLIKKYWA